MENDLHQESSNRQQLTAETKQFQSEIIAMQKENDELRQQSLEYQRDRDYVRALLQIELPDHQNSVSFSLLCLSVLLCR